jgi:5-methylcytosine-specific restriction enzyme A
MSSSNKRVGDKIYHTQAWRKLRRSYFNSKHGLCERCERPGNIVHHKIEITQDNVDDPFITLNSQNLELLCHDCHNKHHKQKYSPLRDGFAFDENGDLIQDK